MLPAAVTLTPVAEPDFAVLGELAGTIWRQHYAGIISAAQIDYMLAARLNEEALRENIQAADRWLELQRQSATPVGYCGYELAGMDDDRVALAAMNSGNSTCLNSTAAWGSAGPCSCTSNNGHAISAVMCSGYRSTRGTRGRSRSMGQRDSRSSGRQCSRSVVAS